MAMDRNDRELKIGDVVTLMGVVTFIDDSENRITVETESIDRHKVICRSDKVVINNLSTMRMKRMPAVDDVRTGEVSGLPDQLPENKGTDRA